MHIIDSISNDDNVSREGVGIVANKLMGKKIRFKVKNVACSVCQKEFPVKPYKNLFPFPKSFLPKLLPKHNCEDK